MATRQAGSTVKLLIFVARLRDQESQQKRQVSYTKQEERIAHREKSKQPKHYTHTDSG